MIPTTNTHGCYVVFQNNMSYQIKNKSYNDTTISFVGAGTYTIPLANLGIDVTETISSAEINSLIWSTNNSIIIKRSYVPVAELFHSGNIKLDEINHTIANNKTGNIQVVMNGGGSLVMQMSKVVGEPAEPTDESEEPVDPFTFYEAIGSTTAISTTQYIRGIKIYAESSTYDVPGFKPARIVVNDIQIVSTELRGHTLLVLDSYGNVVSPATQYDTYINPANVTALASALSAVAIGNIVVLVSYDASAVDAAVRSAINTGYGSTNSNTWTPIRYSHIFIGKKT